MFLTNRKLIDIPDSTFQTLPWKTRLLLASELDFVDSASNAANSEQVDHPEFRKTIPQPDAIVH